MTVSIFKEWAFWHFSVFLIKLQIYVYFIYNQGDSEEGSPLIKKQAHRGAWVAQLVKWLPSAQVMIQESQDGVSHGSLWSAGSLLLPLTSTLMLSLTLSLSLSLKIKIK